MTNIVMYKNVFIGNGTKIDDFCVLGYPPGKYLPGELELRIGIGGIIRSHTCIYAGVTIGDSFQSGHHVLIRQNTIIGNECSVGSGCILEHNISMGNQVRLHSNVFVPEYTVFEDECWIGPNVVFTNSKYPNTSESKKLLSGAIVKKRARIGANVTILPGVCIGIDAFVGAGAVVVKDVQDGQVVVGNPSKVMNKKDLLFNQERD